MPVDAIAWGLACVAVPLVLAGALAVYFAFTRTMR